MTEALDRCLKCGGSLDSGYLESARPINWVRSPSHLLHDMARTTCISGLLERVDDACSAMHRVRHRLLPESETRFQLNPVIFGVEGDSQHSGWRWPRKTTDRPTPSSLVQKPRDRGGIR